LVFRGDLHATVDMLRRRVFGRSVKDQHVQVFGLKDANGSFDMTGGHDAGICHQQDATPFLLDRMSPKHVEGVLSRNHPGADGEIERLHGVLFQNGKERAGSSDHVDRLIWTPAV
jgi:hypothetical protein